MVGTEGAYVEESLAGRMFLAYYGRKEVMKSAIDILDGMGISDWYTRTEVTSIALWAAQLVGRLRSSSPTLLRMLER